jgi:hypothetical protein
MPRILLSIIPGLLLLFALPPLGFSQQAPAEQTGDTVQSEQPNNGTTKKKKRRPKKRRRPRKKSNGQQRATSPSSAGYSPGPVASRRPGIFTAEVGLNNYYDSNFGLFSQRDRNAYVDGAADPRYGTGTVKRFRIENLDDFVIEPSFSFAARGRPLAGRFAEIKLFYNIALPMFNSSYNNMQTGLTGRHQIFKYLFAYGGFEFLPYNPGRNLPLYDDQDQITGYAEDWQKGYNLDIGLGYYVPKLLKVTAGYRFDWENHAAEFTERDGAAHNMVVDLLVHAWPPILKTSLELGYRVFDCVGDRASTVAVEPSTSSITISYLLRIMAEVYDFKSAGEGELGISAGQRMIDFTSPYQDDLSHKGRADVVTELGVYFSHSFGLGLKLRLDYTNRSRVTNLDNPVREETYEVTDFRQYQVGLTARYSFGSFGPTIGK